MRIETLAVHAGHAVDLQTGAVTPPIHMSTTFEREADGSYRQGHQYSRTSNPTRQSLEACLAALEAGAVAAAFSSGSAATFALFQSLRPGDHVLLPNDAYFGTAKLVREVLEPWGLAWSAVDMVDLDAVRAAMRKETRVVWVETPSNPLVRIVDIAAVADIARSGGAWCVCDNTWASPVLTQPLALGAHVVMHSTTKYLAGHGDVLGGALVAAEDDELFARIRMLQVTAGMVPSPFECWLLLRGIRTLPWRMRAQCANAATIAGRLVGQPGIEAVHYPGLPTHAGHGIATRQMRAYGGMLSIQVRGGEREAMAMAARLQLITRATSLGGSESLIEHRASVEGAGTMAPPNLLRMSVGLEHAEDLLDDLLQALEAS